MISLSKEQKSILYGTILGDGYLQKTGEKNARLRLEHGKKKIPDNLEKYLHPIMLTVWYMDDGYYYKRDKCSYLYLGNTTQKEAEIVAQALLKNFNLLTKVKQKKRGYAIYTSPKETLKLKGIIKNYIIPQFNYKLPPSAKS